MKPKSKQLDPNGPWIPGCWVVDGRPVGTKFLEDDSRRKYAAVKVNAAIMKAMRHDN